MYVRRPRAVAGCVVSAMASHTMAGGEHVYAWDFTYTFEGTPVPEPASLVGLAAGIGALGAVRIGRRRHW